MSMRHELAARVVETHTSTVVFVGDRAYKVKKAVDLGFLDFTSRYARAVACRDEVTLNQRLAPDVYLGVATVLDPDGDPCESMVVMRRMPDERKLTTLLLDGAPLHDEVARIASVVADFHRRSGTSAEITAAGSRDSVASLWREGVEQLRRFCGPVLASVDVDEMAARSDRFLGGRNALFTERQAAGLVRDGHGDLLADDIFCLDDGPRILDCIEFDQRLRVGDVLLDVAFLAMDLERLGAPDLAREFVDSYCECAGEQHPSSLENLYIAYRAFVRAKVACLRWEQGVADSASVARQLSELTLRHLRKTALPLVLVGGTPGVGKTTLARALVAAMNGDFVLIRSDVVRKQLAGLDPSTSAAAPFGAGLYRPQHTAATYTSMMEQARHALESGRPVILDASWGQASRRAEAAGLASGTGADLVALRCTAPIALVEQRLARRRADASDADPAIAAAVRRAFEPWPDAHGIDMSLPLDAATSLAAGHVRGSSNAWSSAVKQASP